MLYFQKVGPPSRDDDQDLAPTIEAEASAAPDTRKNYTRYLVVAGCIAFAGLVVFIAIDIIFFGTVHQNTMTEWADQKLADKDAQRQLIPTVARWIGRILSKH